MKKYQERAIIEANIAAFVAGFHAGEDELLKASPAHIQQAYEQWVAQQMTEELCIQSHDKH